MISHKKILMLTASLLMLAGCAGVQKGFSNDSPQLVAQPDSVTAMLAVAADRASTALETLAAVEYARTPTPKTAPVTGAPKELSRAVTVDWVGPVENIVQKLANRASYNFIKTGNPPPVPIVVSVNAENDRVIEVLRDIGFQMGQRATIRVEADKRLVEIQYAPNSGVGEYY